MANFLDTLDLSGDERAKLGALGADSPFALLALRKASQAAFDAHIGPERAKAIAAQLETLLDDNQRAILRAPTAKPGALGGRLTPKSD